MDTALFNLLKICPINCKVDLNLFQILNKPPQKIVENFKFSQSGEILPNLVTLCTRVNLNRVKRTVASRLGTRLLGN